MAEPAFSSGDDPEAGKPDPMAPGWADVRRGLVITSRAVALAAEEAARDPGSTAALEMLQLCHAAQESYIVIGRRWEVDEAAIEAERARAFKAGYDTCKAERCRMQVIDGGRAG